MVFTDWLRWNFAETSLISPVLTAKNLAGNENPRREEKRFQPNGDAAQQVAGRAHLAGIDIGVGEVVVTQQGGDLVGVDSVVLRLAAVDGLHVKGVAEDKGEALLATEVGD